MKTAFPLFVVAALFFILPQVIPPGMFWSAVMTEEMNNQLILQNKITGNVFLTPRGVEVSYMLCTIFAVFGGVALVCSILGSLLFPKKATDPKSAN